jgi:hypothetical protein
MAAILGARLATHLEHSLMPNNIYYWSDSQIVLHWLATTKPLKQFERNRVTEIKNLSKLRTWKYCPTECNPADLLTRGISAQQLSENKLWNDGPEWLNLTSMWPRWERSPVSSNYEQNELSSDASIELHAQTTNQHLTNLVTMSQFH